MSQYLDHLLNKYAQPARQSKTEIFFDMFLTKFKAILTEIRGDFETLKIKGFNREDLQLLFVMYNEIKGVLHSIETQLAADGLLIFSGSFLSKKENVKMLTHLNAKIQNFLQESKIQFSPHTRMKNVEVNGIKNLLHLVKLAELFIERNPGAVKREPYAKLINEKEDFTPVGPTGATRVVK